MARNTGAGQTMPAPKQQNGAGTGIAPAPGKEIQTFLNSQRERIAEVLPPTLGLTPERVIKLACLSVHKKAELSRCSHLSILSAVLEASSLGLEIGGPLAEAHLVPFGQECTFLPDYKGLLKLARRSGEFETIEGVEVFERDTFRVFRSPAPTIQHELCLDGERGQIRYVYAYAALRQGGIVFEVMNREQVESVRLASRSANSPAWKNWWGEMAKKVVLKRLLKRQARSVEVARAIEADDREYVTEDGEVVTVRRVTGHQRGVAGLRSQLAIEADAPALPPQESRVYSEAEDAGGEAEELAGDTGDGGQLGFAEEPGARG